MSRADTPEGRALREQWWATVQHILWALEHWTPLRWVRWAREYAERAPVPKD